jgi:hypothetical protein
MKNCLVIALLVFSTNNHAGWFSGLAKLGKGAENAVSASKAVGGAKGAAATGIAVSELDDAARAAKLNLAHPGLPDYETALILNNHYPWATTRLGACIARNSALTNNSSLVYCTTQYQKCIDERNVKATPDAPNEVCITQTNKENKNEKK